MKLFFLIAAFFGNVPGMYLYSQEAITGKLADEKTKQPIPFANIALYGLPDSSLIAGTTSDTTGTFSLNPVRYGNYRLVISEVGYHPVSRAIDITESHNYNFGTLFLHENIVELNEAIAIGKQMRAKTEPGKTTFFITKKMADASNTGTDVLKLIPGIQVDLMHNISLEGSSNILILVDGRERDNNFVSQINPVQIEKVEVMSSSLPQYDANVTGVINIILKKERDAGVSGHVYAEIPTSSSEVYISPDYGFNYGTGKLNLYTSYNGQLAYFNILESTHWKSSGTSGPGEIFTDRSVRQKNWTHRFHYGFDYFFNHANQVNFYGFFNPYSSEMNGLSTEKSIDPGIAEWQAKKNDTDINYGSFYSLYYKHLFPEKGNELTLDISNYHLKSKSTTTYIPDEPANHSGIITNSVKPRENDVSIKIDYNSSSSKKLSFATGVKAMLRSMSDADLNNFRYTENTFAAYSNLVYRRSKYDASVGLRLENSAPALENSFRNTYLSLMPHASLNVKISPKQHIQLTLSRSVYRPQIYQLNPSVSVDGPYIMHEGNPLLKPEFHNTLYLEHFFRFKSNYIASRLYYTKTTHAINNLAFLNDTSAFETRVYNLGTIHQYGLQFTGALRFGKALSVNPYFRVFEQFTAGNNFARESGVINRHQIAFETSLSTVLSLKHDMDFTFSFQYANPKNNIQNNSFSDALYFVSFEKTIKKKFKVGIVSGLPLNKTFVYTGAEISQPGLYARHEGTIRFSGFPVWFKLDYQFTSGHKRERINRATEDIHNLPSQGF